jgi:DNA-binding NarL/FixJ family response regulator
MLQNEDYQVVGEAADGQAAVQQAKDLQSYLILLDVGLAELSGIGVAEQVRDSSPCSRILILSQDCSSEIVRGALDAGALGYVHEQRLQREPLTAVKSILAGSQFVSEGVGASQSGGAMDSFHFSHCNTPAPDNVLAANSRPDKLDRQSRLVAIALRRNALDFSSRSFAVVTRAQLLSELPVFESKSTSSADGSSIPRNSGN